MNIKEQIRRMTPPCAKCPYKLGRVQTVVNPCPQCRENGYRTFERFQRERTVGDRGVDGGDET